MAFVLRFVQRFLIADKKLFLELEKGRTVQSGEHAWEAGDGPTGLYVGCEEFELL